MLFPLKLKPPLLGFHKQPCAFPEGIVTEKWRYMRHLFAKAYRICTSAGPSRRLEVPWRFFNCLDFLLELDPEDIAKCGFLERENPQDNPDRVLLPRAVQVVRRFRGMVSGRKGLAARELRTE